MAKLRQLLYGSLLSVTLLYFLVINKLHRVHIPQNGAAITNSKSIREVKRSKPVPVPVPAPVVRVDEVADEVETIASEDTQADAGSEGDYDDDDDDDDYHKDEEEKDDEDEEEEEQNEEDFGGMASAVELPSFMNTKNAFDISVPVDESTSGLISTNPILPVYWINLKQSTERAEQVRSMLASLPSISRLNTVRIEAQGSDDVMAMLFSKSLSIPDAKIVTVREDDKESNHRRHRRSIYNVNEVACTISHIKAIKQAYDNDDDYALIAEDDFVMSEKFVKVWKQYADAAPSNWEIIQFYTNNEYMQQHLSTLEHDPFVRWSPEHWGTTAYLINRKGIEAILTKAVDPAYFIHTGSDGDSDVPKETAFHFKKSRMILADELIYYHTVSYTATYPLFKIQPHKSLVQTSSNKVGDDKVNAHVNFVSELFDRQQSRELPYKIFEGSGGSIANINKKKRQCLVITYSLVKNGAEASSTLRQLKENINSFDRVHFGAENSNDWHITLAVTNPALADNVNSMKKLLFASDDYKNVVFKIVRTDGRFNKFAFVKDSLDAMNSYHYVMMKDADMNLDGYPWHKFWSQVSSEGSVVTGTVRQSQEESLRGNVKVRLWFQIFDSRPWKTTKQKAFLENKIVPTDFIEQFFTVLDGDFASFFFNKILEDKYMVAYHKGDLVDVVSSWGPDLMWCGGE